MLATTFPVDSERASVHQRIVGLLLPGFPQFSMHSLHNTLRDSQRRVSPFKPGFNTFPLENSRFVAKDPPDCSFAQAP